MALSTIIQTSRHGSLTLLDGTTPTALTYSVRYDKGDFSVSGLSPDMAEIITFAARHVHIGHAKGAPTYPTVSFSMFITDYSETSAGTIQDFLHATSGTPYAARATVSTTTCQICSRRISPRKSTNGLQGSKHSPNSA